MSRGGAGQALAGGRFFIPIRGYEIERVALLALPPPFFIPIRGYESENSFETCMFSTVFYPNKGL